MAADWLVCDMEAQQWYGNNCGTGIDCGMEKESDMEIHYKYSHG